MKETCEQMDCELLEFGGEDDHIHMMVSVHPKLAISNLVSKLKGKSSYMIRREYWDRVKTMLWGNPSARNHTVAWRPEMVALDVVREYINNQNEPPSEKAMKTSQALKQRKE